MEALHDIVKAGKARYIGASSMEAWRFAKLQHAADRHGWTKFISMQPQYNLLYREEEREMLPLCLDQGLGVISWSPLARGKLTRDWEVEINRSQNDAFGRKMHAQTEQQDKIVVEAVQRIAAERGISRAQVALAWVLSKSAITAPIVGATKPEQLANAITALDVTLSEADVSALQSPYVPRFVEGVIPPVIAGPPTLTVIKH